MNRLNTILFFFSIMFAFSWAQTPTITLNIDYYLNPTYPLEVTGKYSLADSDSLYSIKYYIDGDSTEVTNIDTINQTFSATIENGPAQDGDYYYIFKLRSMNGLGKDTLQIHVDFTAPQLKSIKVDNEYWSYAYPQFEIEINFDEAISIKNAQVELESEDGLTFNIPRDKISLQNADSRLVIQVSKDLISDALESWTGNVSLIISNISDKVGNIMSSRSFNNIIIADFTIPMVLSFEPRYGHISTKYSKLDFKIIFNEKIKVYKDLIKVKKEKLVFMPNLYIVNTDSSEMEFTVQLKNFESDTNWNGNVEIEMQAFTDKAGNTNEANKDILPRIYIDFIGPKVNESFLSKDSINIDFISQPKNEIHGLISFNEPLDTTNTNSTLLLTYNNKEDTIRIMPNFENNNKDLHFVIDRKLLESHGRSWQDLQDEAFIFFQDIMDTLGNKAEGNNLIGRLLIDVLKPEAPSIINADTIKSIVKDKKIFFKGSKEYRSKLYLNGELLSNFTKDTTWNKNVFLSKDGFYKFNFWQVDTLGNTSDTTVVRIIADRQIPQFAGPGAQLQLNTDSNNKPYFILYLYFNEIINFESDANLQLKTDDDYFQIRIKKAQNLSTIHKIVIADSSQVNQLFNWLKQEKSIQIFIPRKSITDLAGNVNKDDMEHEIFVFIESLITDVDWINRYISPNDDGKNDELRATVRLSAKAPENILFRVVVLNQSGQSVLQVNKILNISEDTGTVKLFENGEFKVNSFGSDSNRVVNFDFKWAPQNLDEGKYTISFYAQEQWEQGYNLSIGSLPISASVYVDVTPPNLIRITPVAGDNNQYIDIQPDFVFVLDKDKEISPIKNAYLIFSKALRNDMPFTEAMDLFPYKPGEVYEFNCKSYNIKLVPGDLAMNVTLVDSANNVTTRQLHYVVVGDTVEGIKDVYNFPNPFNPKQGQKTNIAFVSGQLSMFKLYIFDMGFNLVYYKEFSSSSPGLSGFRKTIPWDGTNLKDEIVANGVYFARIVSGKYKSPILKIVVNNK